MRLSTEKAYFKKFEKYYFFRKAKHSYLDRLPKQLKKVFQKIVLRYRQITAGIPEKLPITGRMMGNSITK